MRTNKMLPVGTVADNLPENRTGNGNMVEKGCGIDGSGELLISNRVAAEVVAPLCNFTSVSPPAAYPYTPSRCAPWIEQKSFELAAMRSIVAINKGLSQPLLQHFYIHIRTTTIHAMGRI